MAMAQSPNAPTLLVSLRRFDAPACISTGMLLAARCVVLSPLFFPSSLVPFDPRRALDRSSLLLLSAPLQGQCNVLVSSEISSFPLCHGVQLCCL